VTFSEYREPSCRQSKIAQSGKTKPPKAGSRRFSGKKKELYEAINDLQESSTRASAVAGYERIRSKAHSQQTKETRVHSMCLSP
jgi:hypothetical protein